jgi:large subunit ribosomal protein L6e
MVKRKVVNASRRVLLRSFKAPEVDKTTKYYPTEDVAKPTKRAFKPKAAKLRASIKPGSVVILLSGRFRGKRVVFCKQLASGLLLVTGPYGVNGVPLRRVNQAYVIATSTVVDAGSVKKLAAAVAPVTDAFFARKDKAASKTSLRKVKSADDFAALQKAPAKALSDERKAKQAEVDAAITAKGTLEKYLKARFSLSKGSKPHAMAF